MGYIVGRFGATPVCDSVNLDGMGFSSRELRPWVIQDSIPIESDGLVYGILYGIDDLKRNLDESFVQNKLLPLGRSQCGSTLLVSLNDPRRPFTRWLSIRFTYEGFLDEDLLSQCCGPPWEVVEELQQASPEYRMDISMD